MKHLLLDTDVILDLYLDREPFADASAALWQAHEAGHITAYVSAIPVFTPLEYISQFPLTT